MKTRRRLLVIGVGLLLLFALYKAGVVAAEHGRAAAANRLLDHVGDPDECATALAKLGESAIEPSIQHLWPQDTLCALAAERALGRMGALAIEPLREVLRTSPYEDARIGAVHALQGNNDPRSIAMLIAAFKDRSKDVREAACCSLWSKGDRATGQLLAAIKDRNTLVRMYSARVLLRTHDRRAVGALMMILQNRENRTAVRCEAATFLGAIGDNRTVPALVRVVRDMSDVREVRLAAARGLCARNRPAAQQAVKALRSDKDPALRDLVESALP